MAKLVYPELSYEIVGILFTVYNNLRYGYQEKYYQRAIAAELKKANLHYKQEQKAAIKYKGNIIGQYFIDFVIENKIVVEIKISNNFYKKDSNQVLGYLRATGLKLGVLFIFAKDGLSFKRIVN